MKNFYEGLMNTLGSCVGLIVSTAVVIGGLWVVGEFADLQNANEELQKELLAREEIEEA